MWLLDTSTLRLCHFPSKPPAYAILSHTWGCEEVLFEEIGTLECEQKHGYGKIKSCCTQATADGLSYAWIDTCCIDKRSSSELSEAINSMFNWYSQAHVCYAYLEDVTLSKSLSPHGFANSRWFTRGWTLQELIAPMTVVFYDRSWSFIGTKGSLMDKIAKITAISYQALTNPRSIRTESIAERMSWAASRTTTKDEDGAYCLMGIFEVNMPLLYGEGLTKAFRRLEMQIMANSVDLSILAWKLRRPRRYTLHDPLPSEPCGVLASSPKDFLKHRTDSTITPNDNVKASAGSLVSMTNLGLYISLPLVQLPQATVAVLNCERNGNSVGIHVHLDEETGCYYRKRLTEVVLVDSGVKLEQEQPICLSTDEPNSESIADSRVPTFLSVADMTNSSHPYKTTRIRIFENDQIVWSDDRKILKPRQLDIRETRWALVLLQNGCGDYFSLLFGIHGGKICSHGVPRDLTAHSSRDGLSLWEAIRRDLEDPKSAWRYLSDRRCYSHGMSWHILVTTKTRPGRRGDSEYEVKVEQISSKGNCIPRSSCSLGRN